MPVKVTPKIARVRSARKRRPFAAPENEQKIEQDAIDVLQQQVEQEFQLCLTFMRPKVDEWLRRLKLYNNQARDKNKVGYPLVYTVHQVIHASLYDDKIAQTFKPREEGDTDTAEQLNGISEYDRSEMQKDEIDEAWNWDAEIFGRGLLLFNDFDTQTKTPIPEVLDPTTFLRDPFAISVNGNRNGNGAMRFGGWEIYQTRAELDANPEYFNLDQLKYGNDEITSLTGKSRRARAEAQGLPSLSMWENLTTNYKYGILRWITHINGEKYLTEWGNNRTLLIRKQKLPWKYWPIIDRPFSPISHDWDGVSIMDLLEDKQRYGAKIMNVAGELIQADLNGMWIYRGQGFKKNQDFNFKFGKWIEYNGTHALNDAAQPLQMKKVSDGVKYVLDWLDIASQKATGTPDIKQGQAQKGTDTLGENQEIIAGSDTRYSLTAKIYGWSEKKFWMQWYRIYDEYFSKGLGKKIARLEGAFGTKWAGKDGLGLTRAEIICGNTMGPDIEIESVKVNEGKKARQLNQFNAIEPLVLQDPQADQMYYKRKKSKLIMPKDEVERIFPVTVDELEARDENDALNEGKYVKVRLEQNHIVHLREHASAKDTPHMRQHIKAHQFMILQKRALAPQMPGLFPQMPEDQMAAAQQKNPNQQPNQPVGATPMGAPAAPMQ